jgi:hypothetical protein
MHAPFRGTPRLPIEFAVSMPGRSMDYALAKQLRDAGYPQQRGPLLFPAGHNPRTLKGRRESAALRAYAPALVELLGACVSLSGGGIVALRHRGGMWSAAAVGRTSRAANPDAAVARLWLALCTAGET